MWQYALWSRTWDWDGAVTIAPAPSADPKFKWIAIDAGAIRHPDWTAEKNAEVLKRDIDQALDRGYQVAIADVWNWSADELIGHLAGLSAANRAAGHLRDAARQLRGAACFQRSAVGPLYELRRRHDAARWFNPARPCQRKPLSLGLVVSGTPLARRAQELRDHRRRARGPRSGRCRRSLESVTVSRLLRLPRWFRYRLLTRELATAVYRPDPPRTPTTASGAIRTSADATASASNVSGDSCGCPILKVRVRLASVQKAA